jgi:hypothetical protein
LHVKRQWSDIKGNTRARRKGRIPAPGRFAEEVLITGSGFPVEDTASGKGGKISVRINLEHPVIPKRKEIVRISFIK